jgi:hypothetical protein
MTEQTRAIPVQTNTNWGVAQDSIPEILSNGNPSFKPVKPENLVRPQGIKPPPPGRTK